LTSGSSDPIGGRAIGSVARPPRIGLTVAASGFGILHVAAPESSSNRALGRRPTEGRFRANDPARFHDDLVTLHALRWVE
jgi:hypothetical protein